VSFGDDLSGEGFDVSGEVGGDLVDDAEGSRTVCNLFRLWREWRTLIRAASPPFSAADSVLSQTRPEPRSGRWWRSIRPWR
jgi:hypothetical protein